MRGTAHCLGVTLLLSGSLGLLWMFIATIQLLGESLHLYSIPSNLKSASVVSQAAQERVPFVLMP